VKRVVDTLGVSERFACRVLGQHRSAQRRAPITADDEAALTADIIALARQYGRYGYRRITALLRQSGVSAVSACDLAGFAYAAA
jgi:putative transposase